MPEAATLSPAESSPAVSPAPAQPSGSQSAQGPTVRTSAPLNDAFADLDKMMGVSEPDKPAKETKPTKPETKQAKPETKPDQPETKQQVDEPDKPEDIPGDKPGKPLPAPELRKAYQDLKTKHAALQAEYDKARTAKPADDPEKKALLERIEEVEKRYKAHEEKLRLSDYSRSAEFEEKWQKPLGEAYQFGRQRTAAFKVVDENGEARQGVPEDFDYIMQITDDDAAATVAEQMFGATKASVVMNMRNEVHRLMHLRSNALQEAQKLGAEREKLRLEADTKQKAVLNDTWTRLNTEAAEKYPDFFKPKDGDDQWNNLLEQGYKLADSAFLANGDADPMESVKLHSAIRNRAAAFGPLAYQNRQYKARIAELEKELSAYKDSEPAAADGTKKAEADDPMNWEAGLERLAR